MSERLIAPSFLFRFAAPCRHLKKIWPLPASGLPDDFGLPSFSDLEGRRTFADFRIAWNETGLTASTRVMGKQQPPWCRDSRIEDSDGLQIWIDTRDTHNIHRAGRFCHRFAFLPVGAGARLDQPIATQLAINRARELPKTIPADLLKARSEIRSNGYSLDAHIPAEALTGFDLAEHPRLGFFFAIVDRELGWQTFSLGPEFPVTEDPSLWGTLELTRGE